MIIPELHGVSGWHIKKRAEEMAESGTEDELEGTLQVLKRVSYELHNKGATSQERALNYGVTSAFQIATIFGKACNKNHVLDKIEVEKSATCRPDSDCWDVKLIFFHPKERDSQAREIHRLTVDVSDVIPVTVGEVRSWSVY